MDNGRSDNSLSVTFHACWCWVHSIFSRATDSSFTWGNLYFSIVVVGVLIFGVKELLVFALTSTVPASSFSTHGNSADDPALAEGVGRVQI